MQERPWALLEKSTWTAYEDSFEKYKEKLLSRSASGVGSRTSSVGENSRPPASKLPRDIDSGVSVPATANLGSGSAVSAPAAGVGNVQQKRATANAPTTAPTDSRSKAPKYGQQSDIASGSLPMISTAFVTKAVTFSGPNRDHFDDLLPTSSLRREKVSVPTSSSSYAC